MNVRHWKDKHTFNVQQLVVFWCWNNTSIQHFKHFAIENVRSHHSPSSSSSSLPKYCGGCVHVHVRCRKWNENKNHLTRKLNNCFNNTNIVTITMCRRMKWELPMPSATERQLECIYRRNHRQLFRYTVSVPRARTKYRCTHLQQQRFFVCESMWC